MLILLRFCSLLHSKAPEHGVWYAAREHGAAVAVLEGICSVSTETGLLSVLREIHALVRELGVYPRALSPRSGLLRPRPGFCSGFCSGQGARLMAYGGHRAVELSGSGSPGKDCSAACQ